MADNLVRQEGMEYLLVRVHPDNRGRVGVYDRDPAHPHSADADLEQVEVFVSGDDVVEVARTRGVDMALREKRIEEAKGASPSEAKRSNEAEDPNANAARVEFPTAATMHDETTADAKKK